MKKILIAGALLVGLNCCNYRDLTAAQPKAKQIVKKNQPQKIKRQWQLPNTPAGKELQKKLTEAQKNYRDAMTRLRQAPRNQKAALRNQIKSARQNLNKIRDEVKKVAKVKETKVIPLPV